MANQGEYAGESMAKSVRMPTLAERLDLAVKRAQEQLDNAKEAREIFNRNPDLERLLNLMQNNNF